MIHKFILGYALIFVALAPALTFLLAGWIDAVPALGPIALALLVAFLVSVAYLFIAKEPQ